MGKINASLEGALVSINGVLTPPEEAVISIFDRGFLYGDSIYEVTLTYDGTPFLLKDHLDRLWRSAQGIGLEISWSRQKLREFIYDGLNKVDYDRAYIRIIITRGGGDIGLDPSLSEGQNLIIIFRELKPYPQKWYDEGVSLIVTEVVRTPKKSMDPNIKSGNYLNNVMALKQAKEAGAYDAIMLNHKGQVTESTSANIWMVLGDSYITPPLDAGLLGGITRQRLLEIGTSAGLKVKEENFTADTLRIAQEVFITSSTREILPITKIDGQPVGDGKPGTYTKKLHQLYKNKIKETIEEERKLNSGK